MLFVVITLTIFNIESLTIKKDNNFKKKKIKAIFYLYSYAPINSDVGLLAVGENENPNKLRA